MGIRENIVQLRALSGMTQDEFASIVGVDRSAVAQWEGGFHKPRMGVVHKLADYFGIPVTAITEDCGMDGACRDAMGRIVISEASMTGRKMLLAIWDSLNDDGKNAALAALRGIASTPAFQLGDYSVSKAI